ncbi:hypothetical protein NDU88_009369 [Pleurodeles waltl]|uniref:Uncharacterized protein n=1 Tax=Pleurodeles waltl TaxID=8319 RepID=A0AAV7RV15_PLEWA|nr:hypothetical protein NDU88_009369 [Pleurodeles waltl]
MPRRLPPRAVLRGPGRPCPISLHLALQPTALAFTAPRLSRASRSSQAPPGSGQDQPRPTALAISGPTSLRRSRLPYHGAGESQKCSRLLPVSPGAPALQWWQKQNGRLGQRGFDPTLASAPTPLARGSLRSTAAAPSWATAASLRAAGGPPSTRPRHTAWTATHRARYQRVRAQAARPSIAALLSCGCPQLLTGRPLLLGTGPEAGKIRATEIHGHTAFTGVRAAELGQTRPLTPPSWPRPPKLTV